MTYWYIACLIMPSEDMFWSFPATLRMGKSAEDILGDNLPTWSLLTAWYLGIWSLKFCKIYSRMGQRLWLLRGWWADNGAILPTDQREDEFFRGAEWSAGTLSEASPLQKIVWSSFFRPSLTNWRVCHRWENNQSFCTWHLVYQEKMAFCPNFFFFFTISIRF